MNDAIKKLFLTFELIYGATWTNHLRGAASKETIMDYWRKELELYNSEDIKNAVNQSKIDYINYPPNVNQFREMCSKFKRDRDSSKYFEELKNDKKSAPTEEFRSLVKKLKKDLYLQK